MRIKSAKSNQGPQANQGVNPAKAASQGSDGASLNLGQEFKGLLETFAGGVGHFGGEISLDTFQVDAVKVGPVVAEQKPTEVQTSVQASALANSTGQEQPDMFQEPQDEPTLPEQEQVKELLAQTEGEEAGASDLGNLKQAAPNQDTSAKLSGTEQTGTEPLAQGTPEEQSPPSLQSFSDDGTEPIAQEVVAPTNLSAAKPSSEAASRISSDELSPGNVSIPPNVVATQTTPVEASMTVRHTAPESTLETAQASPDTTDSMNTATPLRSIPQAISAAPFVTQPVATNISRESIQSLALSGVVGTGAMLTEPSMRSNATQLQAGASAINPAGATNGSRITANSEGRSQRALPASLAARTFERVEQTLKEVARSKDGRTISFLLNPSELGHVKVDVTLREGMLHARLAAENPQVAQLLRDRAQDLQLMLRKLGLDVDKVTVSVQSESQSFGQLEQHISGNDSGRKEHDRPSSEDRSGHNGGAIRGKAAPATVARVASDSALDHWVA
ncbi:MAG: hypothetical protein EBZ48_01830 [Proteobacteria bacterium]|nr:hypothetical protein [Pseudomonadota bacterium]